MTFRIGDQVEVFDSFSDYRGSARVIGVHSDCVDYERPDGNTSYINLENTDDTIKLLKREGETAVEVSAPVASDSQRRKGIPLCTGVLDYFPAALEAVARLSKAGNDKHNPGQPLHHARGKSMDHADCLMRHLADRGETDHETGESHTVAVAWRALAMLQEELEAAGAPKARGAR